jgi:hypothetical protein
LTLREVEWQVCTRQELVAMKFDSRGLAVSTESNFPGKADALLELQN